MKRVVIIGSGLGGLTTGVTLAKNGYRVTVVEQGARVGGCLQCFSRHGVKFETGMHFVGSADEGQVLRRLTRYLEIDTKLRLSRLDTRRYYVVGLRGRRFEFANGREAFIERMAEDFPQEKDHLRRYMDVVGQVAAASSLHSLAGGETDTAVMARYQLRSINEVIDSLIGDPLLRDVLVGDLPLYAAERDKTPFSTHAFIMDFYNQSAFRFVGGSETLAQALVEVLREYGGEVLTRQRATRVVCDSRRATGVEVNDETFLAADYVISAIHPLRTLELLRDTSLIRPAYRQRLLGIPQTVGAFSVYLRFKPGAVPYMNYNFFGYNANSPWGCELYQEDEWPKGYLYMHERDAEEQPFARAGVVLTYMRMEELARWAATTVGRRGDDYRAFVRGRAERLIASLDGQFPGLASQVADYYVSSPLTYRDYTGTEGGSLYGVAKDISLGSAGRVPHRTRVPNLFLAGQNVNSHGMLGVLVATMVACGELLTPQRVYEQIQKANT